MDLCQKTEKAFSWFTPVKDIIENDYILPANTYNPYSGEEEINHREPKEILGEIEELNKQTQSKITEVQKLL